MGNAAGAGTPLWCCPGPMSCGIGEPCENDSGAAGSRAHTAFATASPPSSAGGSSGSGMPGDDAIGGWSGRWVRLDRCRGSSPS